MQAWGVAEARAGRTREARALLRRCAAADPGCHPAWHAWARLEEQAGDVDAARELYASALRVRGGRQVETLSALGRLERLQGCADAAEAHLAAALALAPQHRPALQELANLRRAQGRAAEAAALERQVKRLNAGRASALARVRQQAMPPAAGGVATGEGQQQQQQR